MAVIYGLRNLKTPSKGSVLTIGVFDGVHIGHRKVIKKTVQRAGVLHLESVVLTFQPHPLKVLSPKSRVPSLVSLGHRIRLIGRLGADIIVVVKFSKSFADLGAEKFVRDILVSRLGVREIYVSEGFSFGRGAKASIKNLKALGRIYNFTVTVLKPVKIDGRIVSSSTIRRLTSRGDLSKAARLLGRPVSILGTVVKGISLARELGYPTANVNPHHEAIPPSGVYAVKVRYKDRLLKGVLNIGIRPTFFSPRDKEPSIEVHIFNFHKRIYGEDLEILFVRKIRDEVQFKSRAELICKIRQDINIARSIFS